MSDQQEEQEMEAEALTAIFEDHFEIIEGSAQPFVWKITLWPEATSGDADAENHVGVSLQVTLPPNYPEGEEEALPDCEITILKGLTQDHAATLLELAKEEATANVGVPSIFAICERLREWLVEHNQKGHDDVSMHAQMLRRDAEAKKKEQEKQKLSTHFESQKAHDEMTQAERDELEMRRKRAEGTPVTPETFEAWKVAFEEEMRLLKLREGGDNSSDAANKISSKKAKAKSAAEKQQDENKAGRLTGFQQFSDKAINLEALEAAAENAQTDPDEEEADQAAAATDDGANGNDGAGGIQEELFDVDDEDLDDLDFDDDDEEDEDVDI